jgi:hypothetical protein
MSLTGKPPSEFYKDLIELNNANTGLDATTYTVLKDGAGISLPIQLKKESIAFEPVASNGELLRVNQLDGTKVFSINTSSLQVGISGVADFFVMDKLDTNKLLMIDTSGNTIGIQIDAPDTNACLDMSASIKPVILPKLTTGERDAVTAVAGMIIYNETTNTVQDYNGSAWADI